MKLIKETFLKLKPVRKIKRTSIAGYSGLYVEQTKTGYSFLLGFTSPETSKHRFMKVGTRFKYSDDINKKMLDNIIREYVINQGIVAQGFDPLEKKKAIKEANKPVKPEKITTVSELFDCFTESRFFKQLSPNTQANYLLVFNNHIYNKFGKRDIKTLRRPEMKVFFDSIDMDAAHNHMMQALRKIQRVAIDKELIEAPFLFDLDLRPSGTRTETLNKDEIIALMSATHGLDGLRNVAKFELLTGCRSIEVVGAQWDEFDMKEKTWTIPPERVKTERAYKKMKRPHILPLMPKMSEILLQQRQHGTKGFVFKKVYPNANKKTPYHASAIQLWLKSINSKSSSHWLRRTVASRMSEIPGVGEYDIKLMLNHAASGNTKIYINSQQLERKRQIYTTWHNYLDSLMTETGVQNHG